MTDIPEMKKCQYCGAMLVADAEVCGMCGSPTAPPPPPTYTGPGTVESPAPVKPEASEPEVVEPEIVEPEVVPPSQPEYETPEPVFSIPEPTRAASNRGLAVVVEIAAGIFGFLGIGWMISGKLGLGIGLLVGYWIALVIYFVILGVLVPLTAGLSLFGLCLLPLVPIASGLILYNQTK